MNRFGLNKQRLSDRSLVRCFDVDGVLITYAYGLYGIYACSENNFEEYLKAHNIYDEAVAPLLMQEYIQNCTIKENNFVITKAYTDYEVGCKKDAIMRLYDGKFKEENIIGVKENKDKAIIIQSIADRMDLKENSIVMIDDTIEVLDYIEKLRVTDPRLLTLHVSSFLNIKDWR